MYKTLDPRAHFSPRSAFEVPFLQWRLVQVEGSHHSAVAACLVLEIDAKWVF